MLYIYIIIFCEASSYMTIYGMVLENENPTLIGLRPYTFYNTKYITISCVMYSYMCVLCMPYFEVEFNKTNSIDTFAICIIVCV